MIDPSNPRITPAQKVVIDAMGFLVAERARHSNRRILLEALTEALPHAHATGHRTLDRVILAAAEVSHADREMTNGTTGAALAWFAAMHSASDAMTEFFQWRAGFSIEAFRAALATEGEAA